MRARTLDRIRARNSCKKERSNSLPTRVTAIPVPKARKGHLRLPITSECSLNGLHIARVYTHVHAIARTYAHALDREQYSQTQMYANANKCITAIDTWEISACKRNCKRDCVLRVGSKTFRMYCTYDAGIYRGFQIAPHTCPCVIEKLSATQC